MATLDHIGLNRYIYLTSNTSSMTLGSTDVAEIKNLDSSSFLEFETIDDSRLLLGLNLYKNGPYGFSSWRQIRVHENPLTRDLRRNNKFAFLSKPQIVESVSINGERSTFKQRYGTQLLVDEPAIVSNHKPIVFRVSDSVLEDGKPVTKKFDVISTYNNNTTYFSNTKANEVHDLSEEIDENYNIIKKYYLGNALSNRDTPLTSFETLIYKQVVYPPQTYTYKKYTRERTNFYFNWHDDIQKRHNNNRLAVEPTQHPNGHTHGKAASSSYWPLDVDPNWTTGFSGSTTIERHGKSASKYPIAGVHNGEEVVFDRGLSNRYQTSSFGVLWNNYVQFTSDAHAIGKLTTSGSTGRRLDPGVQLSAGPLYSRRHETKKGFSVVNPTGPKSLRTYEEIPDIYTPSGEAFWDIPRHRGRGPFFNNYEDFSKDIKLIGKDYTILPEYRISKHVEVLLKTQNFEDNFLQIEGAKENIKDSSKNEFYKIYSSTEFLKNFDIILEDHKDFVSPSLLTIRCKAIKKLLPYNSFYSVQRTVDLFNRFTGSYKDNIDTDKYMYRNSRSASVGDAGAQSLYSTLFAPGVLYNTIKSGVACDYPVITSSLQITDYQNDRYIENGNFHYRVPFEAIVDPSQHLGGKIFIRNEVHPSASFLSSSCSWDGKGDQLYKKMVNNFISEIPNFFLEGKGLTTIASAKESSPNFGVVTAGNVYSMRVKMYRSMDQASSIFLTNSAGKTYLPPQDILFFDNTSTTGDVDFHAHETLTMYSRPSAFGPPSIGYSNVSGGGRNPEWWSTRGSSALEMGSRFGRNFPFTPPYYHGQAWADIEFRPTESKKYTLAEIIASSSVKYSRFYHNDYYTSVTGGKGPQSFFEDRINRNAMQLSSSVNLFIAGKLPRDERTAIPSLNDQADSRWIIQTKFETPVLNFNSYNNHNDVTLPNSPASASVPIGMWHQYGLIPENNEGIFLEINDIPKDWVENVLGEDNTKRKSLAEVCGFSTDSKKIGKIAKKKTIHEAVVAVPFIEQGGKKYFYRLNSEQVKQSIDNNPQDIPNTIYRQIQLMKKFVFPPQMDFVNFSENVEPFAMYIFEFKMDLKQEDLSDIWQGIMPSQSINFETSESSISHPLLEGELINKNSVTSNLRWIVFKVKQRANSSYNKITFNKTSPDDNKGEIFAKNILNPEGDVDKVQYNWPYDFFSIVELAKIEAEIGFSNLKRNVETGQLEIEEISPIPDNPIPGINENDYQNVTNDLVEDAKAGNIQPPEVFNPINIISSLPNDTTLAVESLSNHAAQMEAAALMDQYGQPWVESFAQEIKDYAAQLPVGTEIGTEEFGAFLNNSLTNYEQNVNQVSVQQVSVNNAVQGMVGMAPMQMNNMVSLNLFN